jgi:hypothetical protein
MAVIRGDGDMEHWDDMLPVLETWSDKLGVDLVAANPHGGTWPQPILVEDQVGVFFWSYPLGLGVSSVDLRIAFGKMLSNGQHSGYAPNRISDPGGIVSLDSPGGGCVAKVYKNTFQSQGNQGIATVTHFHKDGSKTVEKVDYSAQCQICKKYYCVCKNGIEGMSAADLAEYYEMAAYD